MSITVRQTKHIKAVISTIPDDAWTTIKYPKAVFDEPSGRWISRAEVAEIPFTAFTSRKKSEQVPGRLVVRRIPDLNPKAVAGQPTLFDTWRFHAFFTTSTLDTVTADKTHRGHAIIEQVHADLKDSALAHLPSKSFPANAAWLVLAVIAFNLTRAAAALSGPTTGEGHHRHDPAHPDRCPRQDRRLSTNDDPAPTDRVALADQLDRTVHPHLRTTDNRHLTETHNNPHQEPRRCRQTGGPATARTIIKLSSRSTSQIHDQMVGARGSQLVRDGEVPVELAQVEAHPRPARSSDGR